MACDVKITLANHELVDHKSLLAFTLRSHPGYTMQGGEGFASERYTLVGPAENMNILKQRNFTKHKAVLHPQFPPQGRR